MVKATRFAASTTRLAARLLNDEHIFNAAPIKWHPEFRKLFTHREVVLESATLAPPSQSTFGTPAEYTNASAVVAGGSSTSTSAFFSCCHVANACSQWTGNAVSPASIIKVCRATAMLSDEGGGATTEFDGWEKSGLGITRTRLPVRNPALASRSITV